MSRPAVIRDQQTAGRFQHFTVRTVLYGSILKVCVIPEVDPDWPLAYVLVRSSLTSSQNAHHQFWKSKTLHFRQVRGARVDGRLPLPLFRVPHLGSGICFFRKRYHHKYPSLSGVRYMGIWRKQYQKYVSWRTTCDAEYIWRYLDRL